MHTLNIHIFLLERQRERENSSKKRLQDKFSLSLSRKWEVGRFTCCSFDLLWPDLFVDSFVFLFFWTWLLGDIKEYHIAFPLSLSPFSLPCMKRWIIKFYKERKKSDAEKKEEKRHCRTSFSFLLVKTNKFSCEELIRKCSQSYPNDRSFFFFFSPCCLE